MKTIVIDYGMGNVGSVINMLKHIGAEALLTKNPEEIASADRLLLPGVGSFDTGMQNLRHFGLLPILNEQVLKFKKPILGICLGMQLFAQTSEEGTEAGLGWLQAQVKRFDFEPQTSLKIPHMGWNNVIAKKQTRIPLLDVAENRFYFVHSYYFDCNDTQDIWLSTNYGDNFTSGIQHDNIFGVQFHPEKSHRFGMTLLKGFIEAEFHAE